MNITLFEKSFNLSKAIKQEGLSLRARNVLVNNVRTLEELLNLDRDMLASFRNCGHQTILEILDFQQTIYQKSGATVSRDNFEHHTDNSPLASPPEPSENQPPDHLKDFRKLVFASDLSVRAKNVLIDNVESLEKFLGLSETQMFALRNAGKKTVVELLRLQKALRRDFGVSPTTEKTGKSFRNFQLHYSNSREEIDFFQFMCDMLSVRGNNVLIDNQVNTLEKFMKLSIDSMLKLKNCGRKTVTEFTKYQNTFQEIVNSLSKDQYSHDEIIDVSPLILKIKKQFTKLVGKKGHLIDPTAPYSTLMEWVSDLSSILTKSESAKTAFLLRYGMSGSPPQTLDEIGSQLGVTRERARQILKKLERAAKGRYRAWRLKPLFRSAAELVDSRGGKIDTAELASALLAKGPGGEALEHATRFFEFLSSFSYWDKEGLSLNGEGHVCTSEYMRIVRKISPYIVEIAEENADEVLDHNLWSIDITTLKKLIVDKYNNHNKEHNITDVSEAILDEILSVCDTEVKKESGRLYSRDYWELCFGGTTNASCAVLLSSNKSIHFSEVFNELLQFRSQDPKLTEHNLYASMERNDDLFLWGRGTFIHKNKVVIPHDLISKIERWLLKKLRKNIPFISAYGPFTQFKDICINNNIPNEIALYSLLRHLSHPLLVYPRLPYIYLEDNYACRIPTVLAMEQFIHDSGGPVPYKELKHFVTGRLFLKDYQFTLSTASLPNVVRTKRNGFLHTDFLNLEEEVLDDIIHYAREIIRKEGHVSVNKIFEDKMVSSKIIGIDSPKGLFSLFQLYASDDFDLSNYLALRLNVNRKKGEKRKSIFKEVSNYLEKKNRPCGYLEIYEVFVEGLGYKERIIYDCAKEDHVFKYSDDSLVHTNTLGFDETKRKDVEKCALDLYNNCAERAECYALITKLLESPSLPNLKPGLYWTKSLLADFLANSGKFKVLGNANNAYVPKANKLGIKDLEDLVYEILKRKHNGAANLNKFSDELAKMGIVKKQITPGMLPGQQKVAIVGKEIITNELLGYA